MVARDFDQYLFFYEFLNAFTGIIGKKIDRERVKSRGDAIPTTFTRDFASYLRFQ